MTKEEALIKIGELVAYARTQGWDDDYTDAFKTLEQEPCEDAVSRSDVMDMTGLYADWFESSDSYNDFVAELYKLPPVTPKGVTVTEFADKCRECGKQKKGKWIKNSWEICYTCTRCWKTNPSGTKYPYCPNCGAEMESEE